jgi:hypothetical protein
VASIKPQKYRDEIKKLQAQIEGERVQHAQILAKKNSEIELFRDELDIMLQELEELRQEQMEKELQIMQKKSDLVTN